MDLIAAYGDLKIGKAVRARLELVEDHVHRPHHDARRLSRPLHGKRLPRTRLAISKDGCVEPIQRALHYFRDFIEDLSLAISWAEDAIVPVDLHQLLVLLVRFHLDDFFALKFHHVADF